jgi:hypothetical protein
MLTELCNTEVHINVYPLVSSFNAEDYIKQWLRKGHWDANYTACAAPSTECSEHQITQKLKVRYT